MYTFTRIMGLEYLIPIMIYIAYILWIQKLYLPVKREYQRLDQNTKTPLITLFTDVLGGIENIRNQTGLAEFFTD
jgi:hypothetical protein